MRSKRRELHERIAGILTGRFPERVESEPELLAHHLSEAHLYESAIEQWKLALTAAGGASPAIAVLFTREYAGRALTLAQP